VAGAVAGEEADEAFLIANQEANAGRELLNATLFTPKYCRETLPRAERRAILPAILLVEHDAMTK
jgi:hypothetical protein